jgi:hypothetical protein
MIKKYKGFRVIDLNEAAQAKDKYNEMDSVNLDKSITVNEK